MTFKELKNKVKEQQKELAQSITRGKFLRKPRNRTEVTEEETKRYYASWYGSEPHFAYWKVEGLGYTYRHIHIAYCEFFNNTPYEKIETPRDENPARRSEIDKYKKQWESQIDEVIRDCAA